LLSLGNTIFLFILLASAIIEKTLLFKPKGKLELPYTKVNPIPKFLFAGFSFCTKDKFLIVYFSPYKF
jgi:hypothetical protein